MIGSAAVGAVVPGVSVATGAIAGTAIGGVAGAIWCDRNNDGYVDGYTYNGKYYAGTPAGYDNTLGRVETGAIGGAALGAVAGAVVPGAILGSVAASANSEVVRFMPWPPPVPSSMVDVTPYVPTVGRFADVSERLEHRLLAKGYDRLLFYGIPGGFAVTTSLERFGPDGRPTADRFVEGKLGGWHGFKRYWEDLLWGEQGRFRMFVFAVTSQRFSPTDSPPTETDLQRWQSEGTLTLPEAIGRKPAPNQTQVTVLVYEFASSHDRAGGVKQAHDRVPSLKQLHWLGFPE